MKNSTLQNVSKKSKKTLSTTCLAICLSIMLVFAPQPASASCFKYQPSKKYVVAKVTGLAALALFAVGLMSTLHSTFEQLPADAAAIKYIMHLIFGSFDALLVLGGSAAGMETYDEYQSYLKETATRTELESFHSNDEGGYVQVNSTLFNIYKDVTRAVLKENQEAELNILDLYFNIAYLGIEKEELCPDGTFRPSSQWKDWIIAKVTPGEFGQTRMIKIQPDSYFLNVNAELRNAGSVFSSLEPAAAALHAVMVKNLKLEMADVTATSPNSDFVINLNLRVDQSKATITDLKQKISETENQISETNWAPANSKESAFHENNLKKYQELLKTEIQALREREELLVQKQAEHAIREQAEDQAFADFLSLQKEVQPNTGFLAPSHSLSN